MWCLYLMPQVVDGQHGACVIVNPARPVLGCEVHGNHGGVPVVGDEDAVVPVRAALNLQLQRGFQPGQAKQRVPELQRPINPSIGFLGTQGISGILDRMNRPQATVP